MISLAIFAEETTRVGTKPTRKNMRGPYCIESFKRYCGDDAAARDYVDFVALDYMEGWDRKKTKIQGWATESE